LIVHRQVAAAVVEAIAGRAARLVLGDPLDPATDVGPVITSAAASRVEGMIADAAGEGASVAVGGSRTAVAGCEGGAFIEPTIVTGVRPDHRIATQEVFGPVLAVIEVESLDEAVDVVNGTQYGLSAAVYTQDISAALRAVEAIDAGIVYVNAPTIGAEIHLPFGGTRHSGNGFRDAGRRGLEQFSELKTVYVDYSGRLQRAQIDNRPPPS
jgi:aldehyde dehydrogenase (NAD+)